MPALLLVLLLFAGALPAVAQNQAGVDPLDAARRELQQGHLEEALAAIDQAEKSGSATTSSHDLRGLILLEQGKPEEALASFRAAQKAEPDAFLPRLHIGDALLRAKKWEEARAEYIEVIRSTNILKHNERLRFGILMTHLGAQDTAGAKEAYDRIKFPTESPAYYYAQAAWSYANGEKREGDKWLRTADDMFDEQKTAWFARPLHDFGWIKRKPAPAPE
ncbi:hypothetical protein BH20VER2_BH20VER2_03050 [soil metagenome]